MFQDLLRKYNCSCCQDEIPGLGIECSECTINVRLCFECFSVGAEVGPHKTTHKYHFFDSGSLKLNSSWSAREQVKLLDAIEKYGFGNWQDISKHVETKSPTECKDEYVSKFVEGSVGKATWIKEEGAELNIAIDHTVNDDGPLSPSLTSKLPPLEIGTDEGTHLGYMPERDDFEKEFDNEAEKLVAQLSFSPEDDELEISIKLAMVDCYMQRLRERVRRKRVIRDYQLVSQFFNKKKRKPTSLLTPFAQFSTAREHSQIQANLDKEKELKLRLQELYKYRRAGITKIDKCFEFERKRGGLEDSSTPTTRNLPRHHQSLTNQNLGGLGFASPQLNNNHNSCSSQNQKSPLSGLPLLEKENPPSSLTRRNILQQSSCDVTHSNSEESKSEQASGLRTVRSSERRTRERVMAAPYIARNKYSPLVSQKELKLCIDIKMFPEDYLMVKTALLTDPDLKRPDCITEKEWNQISDYVYKL